MENLKKQIRKNLNSKKKRRRSLARMPIEKKFDVLICLQKMVSGILKSRGIIKEPWMQLKIEQSHISGVINTTPINIINIGAPSLNSKGYLDFQYKLNTNTEDATFLIN